MNWVPVLHTVSLLGFLTEALPWDALLTCQTIRSYRD